MWKHVFVVGAVMLPLLGNVALAFNAPQPIKHNDLFRFNLSPDLQKKGNKIPLRGPIKNNSGSSKFGQGKGSSAPTPPQPTPTTPGSINLQQDQPAPNTVPVLQVRAALNEGLIRSPRVAAVRANLDITKALYAAATQMPNPVLMRDEGAIAEQNRRFGVQTTYDPPWKIAFRLLAAKRQVKASKLEILNTLWLFRNDIRRIYTETVVAQETYQTVSDLADIATRLLDVSQKRFQAGDVPELDVLKAKLAVSQTDIDKNFGAQRVIRAKQQLNVIMGGDLDAPLDVPRLPNTFTLRAEKSDLLPDFEHAVPALKDLVELALANRLELKLINQQIAVAQAQLYNAIGNIIPDPQVTTGQSTSGNPPTGPKLTGFFVTLNIELPLLTFSQGDIARLKATIRQYYQQYHGQENQIIGEVAAAYNNLIAARQRIKVYQDHLLADSQEVARLARRSYEFGQSDITATLQAQQANVQVRIQYLEAVSAYTQAFTDLEQAVGEPLQ